MAKMSTKDKVNYGLSVLGDAGLSRTQALGVMGSFAGESGLGLDTGAFNPADPFGGSHGIGQWNGSRAARMHAFADQRAAKRGLAKGSLRTDFKTQMDFVGWEAAHTHKNAINKVKATTTLYDAAKAWTQNYELPAKSKEFNNKRAANAQKYASLVGIDGTATTATTASVDESVTGAKLSKADDAAVAAADSPAPAEHKGIFGRIEAAVNSIGEKALGIKADETPADNASQKSKAGFLDGDTNFGGVIGSLAGGIFGGPMGSVAGGLIGNAVVGHIENAAQTNADGITDKDHSGILGGITRAMDSILGGDSTAQDSFDPGAADYGTTTQDRAGELDRSGGHVDFGGAGAGFAGGFLDGFAGKSSSSTNQSGGRGGLGVHGIGESEQAGGGYSGGKESGGGNGNSPGGNGKGGQGKGGKK